MKPPTIRQLPAVVNVLLALIFFFSIAMMLLPLLRRWRAAPAVSAINTAAPAEELNGLLREFELNKNTIKSLLQ